MRSACWLLLMAIVPVVPACPLLALTTRPIDPAVLNSVQMRQGWADSPQALDSQLSALAKDHSTRTEQIKFVQVLLAVIARGDLDPQARNTRQVDLADTLVALRFKVQAASVLRDLADRNCGNGELACEAMRRILTVCGGNSREELEWSRYAAQRLLALTEAGLAPPGLGLDRQAWGALVRVNSQQRRFHEAAAALDALRTTGADVSSIEADLYYQAGSLAYARKAGGLGPARQGGNKNKSKDFETPPARAKVPVSTAAVRWDHLFSRSAIDTGLINAILHQSADAEGAVPVEPNRYKSVWCAIDDYLRAQPPAAVAPLRLVQSQLAEQVAPAELAGSPDALWRAARNWPWASQVHQALLMYGERALRLGQAGLALRAFDYVRTHTGYDATRSQAVVGCWLALAADDPQGLSAAMSRVSDAAMVPWMGRPTEARRVKLAIAPQPPEPTPPATAKPLELAAPAPAWTSSSLPPDLAGAAASPVGQLLPAPGGRFLLAGPRAISCFRDGRLLWCRQNDTPVKSVVRRERGDDKKNTSVIPGTFVPAVADGRAITRWQNSADNVPLGLTAFDLETGLMLWSTGDDPQWSSIAPVSDPVVADGRVYVLASQQTLGMVTSVYLVCLRSATGATLWKRPLASDSRRLPIPGRGEGGADLMRFGNAVTVRAGAVYVSTSLGVLARCDATDGQIEWATSYDRIHLLGRAVEPLARRGMSPVVTGQLAVFGPRDYSGLLAVDRDTGATVWDKPLLQADGAAGLAGGLVILYRGQTLFAVRPQDGATVWSVTADGEVLGCCIAGDEVCATTDRGLVVLDASSGASRGRTPWSTEAPQTIAWNGQTLACAGAGPITSAVAPAGQATRLEGLPLRVESQSQRTDARLLASPRGLPGDRVYVASDGLLECLAVPQGATIWQLIVECGTADIAWSGTTMILPADDSLLALDAMTGKRLWQTPVGFHIGTCVPAGPYVLAGGFTGADACAAIDLATGKLLWSRTFDDWREGNRDAGGALMWDGKQACLLFRGGSGRSQGMLVKVRPADGAVTESGAWPGDNEPWPDWLWSDGASCFYTKGSKLHQFVAGDGTTRTFGVALDRNSRPRLIRDEPWILVEHTVKIDRSDELRATILDLRDPSKSISFDGRCSLQNGILYRFQDRQLTMTDLAGGRQRQLAPPEMPEGDQLLCSQQVGARIWTFSGKRSGQWNTQSVRADVFSAEDGKHLGSQQLDGLTPSQLQVQVCRSGLVAIDAQSLTTLGSGTPQPRTAAVWLTRNPIHLDGDLGDWAQLDGPLPMDGPAGAKSSIRIAQDDVNLYLAVTWPAPRITPRLARQDITGGDRIEIGMQTTVDAYHMELVPDVAGAMVCNETGEDGIRHPRDKKFMGPVFAQMPDVQDQTRAVLRYDPVAGQAICEAQIPLATIMQRWMTDWRRMRLSVCVWTDAPYSKGAQKTAWWGDGIGGQYLLTRALGRLSLLPLTHKAYLAGAALADAVPDAPESFDLLWQQALSASFDENQAMELIGPFMQRHPSAITVSHLFAIRRDLAAKYHVDVGQALVDACASRWRLPQALLDRYLAQADMTLSQWVYLDASARSLVLTALDDAGKEHRAFWGKPPGYGGKFEGARVGEPPPTGQWVELRVPLFVLDMADKTIHGLAFTSQCNATVWWGPTAVVAGTSVMPLLNGQAPGQTSGNWQWSAKAGAPQGLKAHAGGDVTKEGIATHSIRFAEPFRQHMETDCGPALVQQVYLDPDDPPRAIRLSLHDGNGWALQSTWGDNGGDGTFAGPMAAPGRWQELRIPLAATDFAAAPICGLAFAHDGGKALWGATTLTDGKTSRVVIDGAMPKAHQGTGPILRSWIPARRGISACADSRGKALAFDGRRGFLAWQHRDELDPPNFTLEARYLVDARPYPEYWPDGPQGGDSRRWLIAKNEGDWHQGHFGLVLGQQFAPAAYLNIGGGGPPNSYQAQGKADSVPIGAWQHLVYTYDGAELRLYADGELVSTVAVNRSRQRDVHSLVIGKRPDGNVFFDGLISRARLYGQALSAEQVRAMARGEPVPASLSTSAPAGAPRPLIDVDARELVVTPDALPAWTWTDRPGGGAKAHTDAPSDGWQDHFVLLAEPLTAHLTTDPQKSLESLRERLPSTDSAEQAWSYFHRMLLLAEPWGQARPELWLWFLKQFPSHPRAVDLLDELGDLYLARGRADADTAVAAAAAECGLDPLVLYQYIRRHSVGVHNFVRDWYVAGPLVPQESKTVYDGDLPAGASQPAPGKSLSPGASAINWRVLRSPTDYVSIDGLVGVPGPGAGALAACVIHSDRPQQMALEVSSRNPSKVYLDGKVLLTISSDSRPATCTPVIVSLHQGPNELIVKGSERWGRVINLWMEVFDPLGKLPQGLRFEPGSPTPVSAPSTGP